MRADLIEKLRQRAYCWRHNDDKARVSVPLGEIRAVLSALEASLQSGLAEDVVKADPEIAEEAAAETEWTAKKAIYKKAKSLNIPVTHQQALELARSTLLVATPAKAAGGWRLVPIEPTREMIKAGGNSQTVTARANRALCYRAMLVASPSSDGERQEGEDDAR
jgi:hypothetical protein